MKNCPLCGGDQAVYDMEKHRNEIERERDENQRLWEGELAQREHREEQIADILREMGSDAEWTSACDLGREGIEVAAALVGRAEKAERERDEARAELAHAKHLVECEDTFPCDECNSAYVALGYRDPVAIFAQ